MGRAMVDLYCASFRQVPKRIVLDIDDTFDAVHGGQQLRQFNAHYDEYLCELDPIYCDRIIRCWETYARGEADQIATW